MAKFEMKDGVAVVTGAASGIGAELAIGLAKRGVHLALADKVISALFSGISTRDQARKQV